MKSLLGRRALGIVAVATGALLGLGGFTFFYAEGASYLSNDPKACVNCHVMQTEYQSYMNSSHRRVATCNDCHVPHDFLGKWLAKGRNGYHHSMAFTLGNFHEPIMIGPTNAAILQANCIRCHETLVHDAILVPAGGADKAQSCVHCHRGIGHGVRQ